MPRCTAPASPRWSARRQAAAPRQRRGAAAGGAGTPRRAAGGAAAGSTAGGDRPPTFLITGSTDGIGLHTACKLAASGATVLLHGRSAERVDRAVERVRRAAGGGAAGAGAVRGYVADLSSLGAVRQLAADVARDHDALHALALNAGVYEPQRRVSQDGYELTWAVNVLAPFLLASLLWRRVTGRIVTTASISAASSLDLGNLQQERGYSAHGAYSASKLCNIIFARRLAALLCDAGRAATSNALDPGTVNTKMLLAGWGRIGIEMLRPGRGAGTQLRAAGPPPSAALSPRQRRLAAAKKRSSERRQQATPVAPAQQQQQQQQKQQQQHLLQQQQQPPSPPAVPRGLADLPALLAQPPRQQDDAARALNGLPPEQLVAVAQAWAGAARRSAPSELAAAERLLDGLAAAALAQQRGGALARQQLADAAWALAHWDALHWRRELDAEGWRPPPDDERPPPDDDDERVGAPQRDALPWARPLRWSGPLQASLAVPFLVLPNLLPGLRLRDFLQEVALRRDTIQLSDSNGVREVPESRLTGWQSDLGVTFEYSGKAMAPRSAAGGRLTPRVARVRDALAAACGPAFEFDSVLVNYYENGKCGMRFHADPLGEGTWAPATAVVSVGAARGFVFRRADDHAARWAYRVASGDAVLMFGRCQEELQHAVIVERSAQDAGPRLSLVYKKRLLRDDGAWAAPPRACLLASPSLKRGRTLKMRLLHASAAALLVLMWAGSTLVTAARAQDGGVEAAEAGGIWDNGDSAPSHMAQIESGGWRNDRWGARRRMLGAARHGGNGGRSSWRGSSGAGRSWQGGGGGRIWQFNRRMLGADATQAAQGAAAADGAAYTRGGWRSSFGGEYGSWRSAASAASGGPASSVALASKLNYGPGSYMWEGGGGGRLWQGGASAPSWGAIDDSRFDNMMGRRLLGAQAARQWGWGDSNDRMWQRSADFNDRMWQHGGGSGRIWQGRRLAGVTGAASASGGAYGPAGWTSGIDARGPTSAQFSRSGIATRSWQWTKL
ncbi:RDH14 [Scenedesmus sp. PABB004]|nr:RDH14 [Scenedesmus sp. PABB004]